MIPTPLVSFVSMLTGALLAVMFELAPEQLDLPGTVLSGLGLGGLFGSLRVLIRRERARRAHRKLPTQAEIAQLLEVASLGGAAVGALVWIAGFAFQSIAELL